MTLSFSFFNQQTGGQVVVTPVTVDDWPVSDGLFTVLLNFTGVSVFDGSPRWLQVEVRPGTSTGPYTVLTPRQPITAAPYALYAFGGPGGGGGGSYWAASGAHIYKTNSGGVGVGTSAPEAPLHVWSGSAGSVTAHSNSIAAFERAGNAYLSILTPSANERGLLFGDPNSFVHGGIIYNPGGTSNGLQFRTNLNATRMVITSDGDVGIGTIAPLANLEVRSGTFPSLRVAKVHTGGTGVNSPAVLELKSNLTGSNTPFGSIRFLDGSDSTRGSIEYGSDPAGMLAPVSLRLATEGQTRLSVTSAGNVGIGTNAPNVRLHVDGGTDISPSGGGFIVAGSIAGVNLGIDNNEIMARTNGAPSTLFLNHDGGDVRIGQGAQASTVYVKVLAVTGADLAEKFPLSAPDEQPEPGTVMELDPDHPGKLRVAHAAYSRRVAGVISGAGDLPVGAVLGHLPGYEDAPPVALSGRVYVRCDARERAIEVGDLLTTADLPGHAMKAENLARAQGAILGKAMKPLAKGECGLVLVLVTLQ